MGKYTKSQIDRAGIVLKDIASYSSDDIEQAKEMLTYWRYIHTPVLNGFQAMLRNKISGKYKKNGFIAQRLKRTPSIIAKLKRVENMRLCRIQDIAGIRAVMRKLSDVHLLTDDLRTSRHRHRLIRFDDYITHPKDSGYRSIHLIFEYYNPNLQDSNGLKVEVQIRTQLQHVWATAVETLGTFLNSSLKSGDGEQKYKDFFAFCSSAFAIAEKCPVLPAHVGMTFIQLYGEVVRRYDELRIEDKLSGYTVAATEVVKISNAKFFLVTLNISDKTIDIVAYNKDQYALANEEYTEKEIEVSRDGTKEVVLVSLDKISALKQAYPNYFLDASNFVNKIDAMRQVLSNFQKKIREINEKKRQLDLFNSDIDSP